jgi:SAM-dependent methyltransferase
MQGPIFCGVAERSLGDGCAHKGRTFYPFSSLSFPMPLLDIDNQQPYWNRVANVKSFTHPLDLGVLRRFCSEAGRVLDFGCGYGRLVRELNAAGYANVVGYDTSKNLIRRGQKEGLDSIHFIESAADLPVEDGSLDAVLIFAVLTCIPSNEGQRALIDLLARKLKPGGIVYVSDYFLQADRLANKGYRCLNDDPLNDGVFTLAEGATFRHHSRAWIAELFGAFECKLEVEIEVLTMNGHVSQAFQQVWQVIP